MKKLLAFLVIVNICAASAGFYLGSLAADHLREMAETGKIRVSQTTPKEISDVEIPKLGESSPFPRNTEPVAFALVEVSSFSRASLSADSFEAKATFDSIRIVDSCPSDARMVPMQGFQINKGRFGRADSYRQAHDGLYCIGVLDEKPKIEYGEIAAEAELKNRLVLVRRATSWFNEPQVQAKTAKITGLHGDLFIFLAAASFPICADKDCENYSAVSAVGIEFSNTPFPSAEVPDLYGSIPRNRATPPAENTPLYLKLDDYLDLNAP